MKPSREALKQGPLLSGLNLDELVHASRREYKKRSIVFIEGEKHEAVFLIRTGAVKVYKKSSNCSNVCRVSPLKTSVAA